jgi:hypothetical protein
VEVVRALRAQKKFDSKPLVVVPAIAWSSPRSHQEGAYQTKGANARHSEFSQQGEREGRGCP